MAKKNPIIFKTLDFFGNSVTLYADTWNNHVLEPILGHPEMAGLEGLVQRVLVDPYQVCRSTELSTAAAYISEADAGPRREGIRVLVNYQHSTFQKGATSGIVTTAYPIDLTRYAAPKLDLMHPIYRKKKK